MKKSKVEFEQYAGNLRVSHFNFEMLTQMWDGLEDEFDPDVDLEASKFYIGKIGKYVPNSFVMNENLNCACISVSFKNGFSMIVEIGDVVFTEEEQTSEEFLLPIEVPSRSESFKELTEAEKEFADRVFLQLVASRSEPSTLDLKGMLKQAVTVSIYRTHQYDNMIWDKSVTDD